MTIVATIFDGAGPGRNAYVIADKNGLAISIPGAPAFAELLTFIAYRTYPGPSAGEPAAWLANTARSYLPGSGLEFSDDFKKSKSTYDEELTY